MNCQLLKLKSGEDIICNLTGKNKTKYVLVDPFIFKVITMVDQNTGGPYDHTSIKDWLVLTNEKIISIPSNHVAGSSTPSPEAKELYLKELKRCKSINNLKKTKTKLKKLPPLPDQHDLPKTDAKSIAAYEEEMMHIMESFFGAAFSSPDESLPTLPTSKHNKASNRPMIQMSMLFPPEVMIELMESGIIDVNDIKKIAKEVKKKMRYTGDEKHRPDFGNKLSDWNPDPNSEDYTK